MLLIAGCTSELSQPSVRTDPAEVVSSGNSIRRTADTGSSASLADGVTSVEVTSIPWKFGGETGQIVSTRHFRLYTTLPKSSRLLERVPLFQERALAHYISAIVRLPLPGSDMDTYLFRTRKQWEAKTRKLLPDQAPTFLNLGRGGFTTRGIAVLYHLNDPVDTLAIAAHEGWHQYTQTTFKNHLPIWLEEGLATYMEGSIHRHNAPTVFRPWMNKERYNTLRRAVRRDDLIPLAELLNNSPQQFLEQSKDNLLLYYAQLWALSHFLVEGEEGKYRADLEQLLIDAAKGRLNGRIRGSTAIPNRRQRRLANSTRVGPGVALEYFNEDLAQFEDEYQRFIEVIVQPRSKGLIMQGNSPFGV